MSEKSLELRIAEKIYYIDGIGSFYRQAMDRVLAEAEAPPVYQLGIPLC